MVLTIFMVVDIPSTYITIIVQATLNKLRVVALTYHMVIFSTRIDIRELKNNPRESRQCYITAVSLPNKARPETPPMDPWDFAISLLHLEPIKLLIKAPLDKAHPDQVIKVGTMLPKEKLMQFINLLRGNVKVFAWSSRDIPRIDLNVAQHHLNISLEIWSVK